MEKHTEWAYELADFGLTENETICSYCGIDKKRADNLIISNSDPKRRDKEMQLKVAYYEETENIEARKNLLSAIDSKRATKLLIKDLIEAGDTIEAKTKIDLVMEEKQEDTDFKTYQNLENKMKRTGRNEYELFPEEINTLEMIASHDNRTAQHARTILYLTKGYVYPYRVPPVIENYYVPDLESIYFKGDMGYYNFKSHLYPNPADNIILIDTNEAGNMQIYDLRGRLLYQKNLPPGTNHIDIAEWNEGLYLAKFSGPSHSETYKFQIIR